jgi:hypothetical protein
MGLIGNKPNQTPTNADLGTMAYEDADYFRGNTEIDTLGTVTTGDIKNSALARSGRATIRPSLLLDFANSKTLDPRITFTRGGIGTYTGYDGLIKSAASNEARFDHNPLTGESLGLLIEEQRTNLLSYSENFDNATWIKGNSTITANAAIAPDGTMTADKHVEDTSNGAHYLVYPFNAVSGNAYTASFYMKGGEKAEALIGFDITTGFSGYQYAKYNLTTKAAAAYLGSPTISMISVGNGWYRCFVTATATGTGNAQLSVQLFNGTTNVYTGDGVSGLYIWGAQLEQGAFATSYIPSADTFTSRASTGTFIGSNGLIQSAATNVARYNYNPLNLALSPKLLLEPASTNLLTYSEDQSNVWYSPVGGLTVTNNTAISPDGTMTADTLAHTNTSDSPRRQDVAIANNSSIYTFSIYVKQGTAPYTSISIAFVLGSTPVYTGMAAVRWSDLAIGNRASVLGSSIIPVGNGWYRFSVTVANNSTGNVFATLDVRNQGDGSIGFGVGTENGTSYIWGAQLETGNTATSYIPTTSAQGTRSADVSSSSAATRPADNAVITGTNFSSWYRQDEGTVFAKADSLFKGANFIASMNNGTNTNSINIYVNNNLSQFEINTNSINQANLNVTSSPTFDFAGGYKVNDFSVSYSGSSVLSDSSGTVPQTNQASLGSWFSNLYLNGHIAKLAYYPKRLSNTELQGLTTT